MSDRATFVNDDGDLRRYRTEIPNIVFDLGLSPRAGWLYAVIKRIAGDSGVCWRGTKGLGELAGMSRGAVSEAKKELRENGLIEIKAGDQRKGESDEIKISNLWRRNFQHFDGLKTQSKSTPETPSNNEHPPVHILNTPVQTPSNNEHPRSYIETKKEPLEEVTKERIPNGIPKKVGAASAEPSPPDVSSPTDSAIPDSPEPEKQASQSRQKRKQQRISAPSPDETERKFRELCERSKHGDALRTLAEIMAEGNETGRVTASRVWREIGRRYLADRKNHQDVSEDAWAYGFEAAITKGAANIGYVTKAARGYRPDVRKAGSRDRRSIAVIGATEEDYREEDYRFHV